MRPSRAGEDWRSVDLDRHVGRVGDDVVDRGTLLRLSHQSLDLVRGGLGVDVVDHFDLAEPVTHLGIGTQDAPDVHVPLERGRDGAQLDLAVLGHSRDSRREAAGQTDQQYLYWCRPLVFGGEELRMVPLENELAAVALLLAEAEETLD